MNKILAFYALLVIIHSPVSGNNLMLKNGSINHNYLGFEVSWDNSWNFSSSGGSYDAIWVFIKGKQVTGLWDHVELSAVATDHNSLSTELTIDAVIDGKGVFILRKNYGNGNYPPSMVEVKSLTDLSSYLEIRIFAIEMVHIPEGSFYLGDGVSISSFGNLQNEPILISSEYQINNAQIKLVNPNREFQPTLLPLLIPSSYPKGHAGFYIMKYEISQIQYVDFLNTLTYIQQKERTSVPPNSVAGTFVMINPYQPDSLYRNSIVICNSGVENTKAAIYGCDANRNSIYNQNDDGLNRAANFLSWSDLSAYLDWSALRPMTEFEFEKVCRGSNRAPIQGEFAWGTAFIIDADNVQNDGTIFESVSDVVLSGYGLANHGNTITNGSWGLNGPLRTGFAASTITDRLTSGSSYYGVMEMSGNVWEIVVMAGDGGEFFKGDVGDGAIDENGQSNLVSWSNPVTATGMIYRGGGWGSTISTVGSWRDLAVSDRFYSHLKPNIRRNTAGGRGAR